MNPTSSATTRRTMSQSFSSSTPLALNRRKRSRSRRFPVAETPGTGRADGRSKPPQELVVWVKGRPAKLSTEHRPSRIKQLRAAPAGCESSLVPPLFQTELRAERQSVLAWTVCKEVVADPDAKLLPSLPTVPCLPMSWRNMPWLPAAMSVRVEREQIGNHWGWILDVPSTQKISAFIDIDVVGRHQDSIGIAVKVLPGAVLYRT